MGKKAINLSLVKGLLLIGVLSVDSAAIDVNIVRLQTGNQEAAELEQANELTNAVLELYNAEKYKDALNPAKKALEIRERLLVADDKLVLASVGNLAAIHLALKNYKEAEVFYKRLLAAHEKRFGPETLQVANTLEVLAWLHDARGNESQAETDYKRVLAIKEKIAGAESKEVARTLFRLAVVQVTITEEGRVVRACAVHGHQLFWRVTERAAYAAQFAPTKLAGKPVRVTGVITYNFVRY